LFLALAVALLLNYGGWSWLAPLGVAVVLFSVALLATGPPDGSNPWEWADRRYRFIRSMRWRALTLGFAGFGLVYIFHRIGAAEPWITGTAIVSGCLIALLKLLELPQAYYKHYLPEGAKQYTMNSRSERAGGQ
jgi:hypothetical protein